jgi:two-component system, cell cycle sensor histidine kinase and response regulator CckA
MASNGAIPRVLVVDDDPSVGEFAARALQTAGYDVLVASNVQEALELADRCGPFDGFVLDVGMPGMSGHELANALRRADPDAKILYSTGFVDTLLGERARLWANEAFVEKPLSVQGLLEAVSLLLHGDLRFVLNARRPERAF